MQLDGFTLIAQIVNFLILVYLLKRFLYKPIIDAMDRREAGIAQQLAQAEQLEQEARAERQRFEQETQQLAARRQDLINQAQAEADEQRQTLLEFARREVEQTRQQWFDELSREREQFLQALRRELGTELCALTRRTLADMADSELQDQIIAVFLRRLQTLSDAQRQVLLDGASELSISTALELDPAQQERLRSGLSQILGDSLKVQFTQQADLICGLVLRTPSGELGWDVNDYLQELADRLRERVDHTALRAANETPNRPEQNPAGS